MAHRTDIFRFARVLFPRPHLFYVGVAGLWSLTLGLGVAATHPESPVAWSVLAASPVDAAPEATVDALLATSERWGTPPEQADALWQAALVTATDLHDPKQALVLLERLRTEYPQSPQAEDALPQKAALLDLLGAPSAPEAWRDAAHARPDHPQAGRWWLRAADAFVARGALDDAEAAYTTATAYPPQAAVAWLALGRLALEEDPAAAHAAFGSALSSARRPATVRLARLGVATALERLEGPDAALAEVDEAIAEEGSDPSLERRRDRLRNGG